MVDTNVVGCSWVQLPAGKWTMRKKDSNEGPQIVSRCQIEVDVAWNNFIAHEPEGDWAKVAPFKILSFDIECANRRG